MLLHGFFTYRFLHLSMCQMSDFEARVTHAPHIVGDARHLDVRRGSR